MTGLAPRHRILIADDHPEFCTGLSALLGTATETVEVVGIAHDGNQAVDQAGRLQPDIVLMDLHMPYCNGVDATRQIIQTSPHIRILVLTMFDDDESVLAAIRAGARGYVLKGSGREDLLRAVNAVSKGELLLGAALAGALAKTLSRPTGSQPTFPELSVRERQILDFIATGANNAAIGTQLYLSANTVRNHITSIFSKLGVTDRAQAIVLVQQRRQNSPT